MPLPEPDQLAREGEEYPNHVNEGDWLIGWHPSALPPPDGKRHGSGAICYTPDGRVVLVSATAGRRWESPAGRPEGDEDWRATLEREVYEEALARIERAQLLGYSRGRCLNGHEEGLVLVRSLWVAIVALDEWTPQHEMTDRRLVAPEDVLETVGQSGIAMPMDARWLHDAHAWAQTQLPLDNATE